MVPPKSIVIEIALCHALHKLGLSAGDRVLVHSSLSSFGTLKGGAPTLIEALQEIVTPAGLIMMPAFTYGESPFNKDTPVKTGLVSETFRVSPFVWRSSHPTHSICAWGSRAAELTAGHDTESAFGKGSPLHKLYKIGGYILLVGVDLRACSMIHVGQEIAKVDYLGRPKMVPVLSDDGTLKFCEARRAGCSLGFGKIESSFHPGEIRETMVGKSLLRLIPTSLLIKRAVEMLSRDQASLFCDLPTCFSCNEAREMIRRSRV